MSSTFNVGRIAGIPIQIHYPWLIVVAFISWSLAVGFFPSMFAGWDPTSYLVVGTVAAAGLVRSALIRELGEVA
jgi:Zn-dependent protease